MIVGGEPEAATDPGRGFFRTRHQRCRSLGRRRWRAALAGGEIATESGACQALLPRRGGPPGGVAGRSGLRRDGPSIRMVTQ